MKMNPKMKTVQKLMFFTFILVPINIKFDVMSLCDMFENKLS